MTGPNRGTRAPRTGGPGSAGRQGHQLAAVARHVPPDHRDAGGDQAEDHHCGDDTQRQRVVRRTGPVIGGRGAGEHPSAHGPVARSRGHGCGRAEGRDRLQATTQHFGCAADSRPATGGPATGGPGTGRPACRGLPPGRAGRGGRGAPRPPRPVRPLAGTPTATRLARVAGAALGVPPGWAPVPPDGVTGRSPVTIACWTRNVPTAGVTFGPGACCSPPAKKAAAPRPATAEARRPAVSIRAAGNTPRGRHARRAVHGRPVRRHGHGHQPAGQRRVRHRLAQGMHPLLQRAQGHRLLAAGVAARDVGQDPVPLRRHSARRRSGRRSAARVTDSSPARGTAAFLSRGHDRRRHDPRRHDPPAPRPRAPRPRARWRAARAAVVERGAELGPAAMDAAAHGAQLHPQRVRDLLVGQALDVAEHDRGPVLGGQRLERGLDVAVQMPLVKGLGRRRLVPAQPLARCRRPGPRTGCAAGAGPCPGTGWW